MLTLANFLTIGGATGITVAVGALLRSFWPQAPEPWITWGVAEFVVFLGGVLSTPVTVIHGILLFVSGMVVAATALGSRTGVQMVRVLKKGGVRHGGGG